MSQAERIALLEYKLKQETKKHKLLKKNVENMVDHFNGQIKQLSEAMLEIAEQLPNTEETQEIDGVKIGFTQTEESHEE